MYLSNKYTNWYNSIISKAISRSLDKSKYYEIHHIVPKCLGGSNDPTNLVKLTAKEHFVCHQLLVRMVQDQIKKSKLAYASWQMTQRYTVSSRKYEQLKIQLSKSTKGVPKSEEHRQALLKPKSNTVNMKGGTGRKPGFIVSEETGNKISKAKKGKCSGSNNPFFGKTHSIETIAKYKELFTRVPLTEEHKANISKGLKGKPSWNKGIPQPRVCCMLCQSEVDRNNLNNHYRSKKCLRRDSWSTTA